MLIMVVTARSVQMFLALCGCEDTMLGLPTEYQNLENIYPLFS